VKIQCILICTFLFFAFNLNAKTLFVKLHESSNPNSKLLVPPSAEGFYRATNDRLICKIPLIYPNQYSFRTKEIQIATKQVSLNEYQIDVPESLPGLCKFKLVTISFPFTIYTPEVNPVIISKKISAYFDDSMGHNVYGLNCQYQIVSDMILENLSKEERERIPANQEIRYVYGSHLADLLSLICDPHNKYVYSLPLIMNDELGKISINIE